MLPWIPQYKRSDKTTNHWKRLLLVVFFFVCFFAISTPASAQIDTTGDPLGVTRFDNATTLTGEDIRVIVARIINIFLGLLAILTVGIMIYAGTIIMTANGDEDKVRDGRKMIVNAIIGLIIILSAYAITRFVMSRLGEATGVPGVNSALTRPGETFLASGALGRAISDHYPFRNQRDVPRNVRITVTFREAIDPTSIITDIHGNGIFGDCVTPDGFAFDWERDCDRLINTAVAIYPTGQDANPVEGSALATYDAEGRVHSVTFHPTDLLGSSSTSVDYTVDLTNAIQRAGEDVSVFANTRSGHYLWEFQTGTLLDTTPPHVTAVYPAHNGEPAARNSVIQIHFSEAVDPSSVQGLTETFSQIIFGATTPASLLPSGEWRITNAYETVEFMSNVPCGLNNSCGEAMYCLPVACNTPDDPSCRNELDVLVLTADLLGGDNSTSFEAIPFTGVMDLAGNALDSGSRSANSSLSADGLLADPHKPAVGDPRLIDNGERNPDNFWWHVTIENVVDRSVAHITEVHPGIDEENVAREAPIEMVFTEPLLFGSLVNISLEEHPVATNEVGDPEPPWFSARGTLVAAPDQNYSTQVELRHRELSPSDDGRYYFVSVPSTVRSINQNCFYPGRGPVADTPNQAVTCRYAEDQNGLPLPTNSGCVGVEPEADLDTGCVQTTQLQGADGQDLRVQGTVEQCLETMRASDISILTSD